MDRRWLVGMAKDWGSAALIVVGVLFVWSWWQPAAKSSGPAPDFEVHRLDGSSVSIADLKEPVLVLNFWATWCGPCRAEIPEFVDFHEMHPEVGVYGVSIDENLSPERLRLLSKKFGIDYEVLHDAAGQAADAYGVHSVPQTFILDKDREIRSVIAGSTTRQRLEQAVQRAQ
jgi:peroxiredoxin